MVINLARLVEQMHRFPTVVQATLGGVSPDDARWRPPDGAWSLLEIVTHLADEETEDFRTRLELTLRDPKAEWPPIDPAGWAIERRYNECRLDESLTRFATERGRSVRWLRGLNDTDVNWNKRREHPKFGPIHAGDILAAWAAHDTLHMRQIAKRLFQLVQRDTEGFSTEYAGEW